LGKSDQEHDQQAGQAPISGHGGSVAGAAFVPRWNGAAPTRQLRRDVMQSVLRFLSPEDHHRRLLGLALIGFIALC
jgi:hypothetical protein